MPLVLSYYDNKILRKRARPIEEISEEIVQLAKEMIAIMDQNNGIGLAAPQVGKSLRLFIAKNYVVEEGGNLVFTTSQVYINPKLSMPSKETVIAEEGCLSIPGIYAEVERPFHICVEAQDLEGKLFIEEAEGLKARIIMHENDHLNGVLFIDRIDADARKRLEPLLQEINRKYTQTT